MPAKRRSALARFLLGCGCLLLLGVGACALVAWKGLSYFTRGAPALVESAGRTLDEAVVVAGARAEQILAEHWQELRADLARLSTDDGVRELWRENPSLARHFGSEEALLARVRQWRPRLAAAEGDLPDWRAANPDVKTFLADGAPGVEIAFNNQRGSRVRFVWEGGRLTYIEVQ